MAIDYSEQFVNVICELIINEKIEYNYTLTYPFVDDEYNIRVVDDTLEQILIEREEKMQSMEEEELILIASNDTIIKEAVRLLYKIEGYTPLRGEQYFRTQMMDYVLDPDYSQEFIDRVAENFEEAKKSQNGKLNNLFFVEGITLSINSIKDEKLLEYYNKRELKIQYWYQEKRITSNKAFLQFIVKAIKQSENAEEFRIIIRDLMNPDYSLAFIDYIHYNYEKAAVFKEIQNVRYLNGIIIENQDDIIINNAYLKEIYELREQKLQELADSNKYFSNELFLREVIVRALHQTNDADRFRTVALNLLDPDYSQQFIDYIYINYDSIVKFDKENVVVEPLQVQEKQILINDQVLEEYYSLRQQKLDGLSETNYLTNEAFLEYVAFSLNTAQNNKEIFYSTISNLLENYNVLANSSGQNKLYPPQIEGTLPAFCYNEDMVIPFIMNKTVGWNEIKGFALKIKNIQNNTTITTLVTNNIFSFNKEKCEIHFTYDSQLFTPGNFYKVQLAYISINNVYGYYSTVGVIKCTTRPEVRIDGLEEAQLHSDSRFYVGYYNQANKDVTEKVYSYNFTIYDENNSILETSGELLHNHENDDNIYESSDSYKMLKSLEENKIYTIVYTVTTANGLTQSSPRYRITQQSTIPPEIEANLIATMNNENGYVDLQLIGKKDQNGIEKVGTGTFLICRASSEDNYGSWSEVDRFALFGDSPSSHHWKDFTVQHGFTYIYSLQQYNKEYQIYSDRMLSNEIIAEFEHSFLYDGKRQLKIKYNPKVTSFKDTILEQKTNTLGGKYPFFFRNGNVNYKEFPISGLISYHSDEEGLFLTNYDLLLEDLNGLTREHTLKEGIKSNDYDYFNNMIDANIAYKLQSEYAKREKSNSQENQIAKKKDKTTNLTDYNIVAERIFKMKVLDFLNDGKPKLFRSPAEGNYIVRLMNSSLTPDDKLSRMIHTFSTTATEIDDCNYQKLNEYNLISTSEPDTKQLKWKTVNIRELINTTGGVNGSEWISIGGENNIMSIQFIDMIPGDRFKVEFAVGGQEPLEVQIGTTGAYYIEFEKAARQVLINRKSRQGQVTYSYYGTSLHHFDTYRYIRMDDIPITQLTRWTEGKDIREFYELEDIKHKITKYYFLNFTKYYKAPIDADFKFWIDGREIDITETDDYQLIKPEYIPEIKLGTGVALDISIQRREIEYDVESTVSSVINSKKMYLEARKEVEQIIHEDQSRKYEQHLKTAKENMKEKYNNFIKELKKALQEKEVGIE